MIHATRLAFAGAVVAGLGAVVGTIWIGARVKEETIVADPYEEGLRYDAERHARATLGWDVSLAAKPSSPGEVTLPFAVADGQGRPVAGAVIAVSVARLDTSRGVETVAARPDGIGRYAAEVDLPAAGPWLLRFDVRRGGDRVRIEKVVHVGAPTADPRRAAAGESAAPCDLGRGPCTLPLDGGGEVTLELGPRPLRTMRTLAVAAEVRGAPGAAVEVSFAMNGMEMGRNASALAPAGEGRHAGKAVLVRCPSGRRDWTAEVRVTSPEAPARTARFELTVAE
ncbi:FixH family protein [Anaeromyxobacter sp. SG66]|uniref:FixH family protein n=1 Tax=Anaeromyxobacter sp. SG66 TaxID=2925410 RepID=UPI001F59D921|nr:FixH family protein [Anaeromyxobacter sp. SG66]